MIGLRHLSGSPLARHPALILRKIRARLSPAAGARWEPAPAHANPSPPAGLADRLRAWAAACPLHGEPFPAGRVFGVDFDVPALLERVRCGPTHARDLTGDIKLLWDFGRGHAAFLNALRGTATAPGIARDLAAWSEAARDPRGPAWSSPMDTAIRAINWLSADALCGGGIAAAYGTGAWRDALWNAGLSIDRNLEARLVSSNHYLSNLLGLQFLGAAFAGHPAADAWAHFATDEFPRALLAQTFPDGGLYEASLPYHALVTEMALLHLLLAAGRTSPGTRDRIERMCGVIAAALDVDGEVFRIGDDDGGRILPLDFVAASGFGRGRCLLALAEMLLGRAFTPPSGTTTFPDSGWRFVREGGWVAALEFGGVGLHGHGSHAHNDDLSVCINWCGHRVVVDNGSGLYTPAPDLRNALRGTAAHSTFGPDGREQRPISDGSPDNLFHLPGPDRAPPADGLARQVRVEGADLLVEDAPGNAGAVAWRFQMAPATCIALEPGAARLDLGGAAVRLSWDAPGLAAIVEPSRHASRYGAVVDSTQLVLRGSPPASGRVTWRFQPC